MTSLQSKIREMAEHLHAVAWNEHLQRYRTQIYFGQPCERFTLQPDHFMAEARRRVLLQEAREIEHDAYLAQLPEAVRDRILDAEDRVVLVQMIEDQQEWRKEDKAARAELDAAVRAALEVDAMKRRSAEIARDCETLRKTLEFWK